MSNLELSQQSGQQTLYRSVDGLSRSHNFAPAVGQAEIELTPPRPLPRVTPLYKPEPAPDQYEKPKRVPMQHIKVFMAIAGLLAGIYFDPSLLEQPHLIAGLYFLLVIVLRINSQKTFLLALAFLISVPVMLASDREMVADQFATLSYFLLAIGVAAAAWEMRKPTVLVENIDINF
jgi:hypothetical protein